MKLLFIHADWIKWEPRTKAIKAAEEVAKKPIRIDECLVVFTAVEKSDTKALEQSVARAIREMLDVAGQVKASRIVLYPYAHLSSNLAEAGDALKVLKAIEAGLKEKGMETIRAPFGWYKSFELKCKGHPLSELSREFGPQTAEEIVSESLRKEEKVRSSWYILTPQGRLHPIALKDGKLSGFDFSKWPNLARFAAYEMAKVRAVTQEPPHVKLMKRLEIADYEPGSDPGNLRWYPKGRLIKALLEKWVTARATGYGAMEIESPVMYDFEHPALKDYLNRFPARQYIVESAKKKFFLRFSACFGQFLMKAGMNISYRFLPLKMYELTRYSFRLEKAGELTGLRRLRAFTMPDMHTLCADLEQAKAEYINQFKLAMACMADMGFDKGDYETGIRFTEAFWASNKDFILKLVKLINRPVLIEMWNFRYAYFDPKFEFNFVDTLHKASALATVQIDHENAQRYGVKYVDRDGKEKLPIIIHCSPSGSIERCIYAMLEKAWMANPERAVLPMWLSPVQVRLCPVNDRLIAYSEKIAQQIESADIRVDVDDRIESVPKKIREAEKEWIPLIVVIGEKEKRSRRLAVRFRQSGKIKSMTVSQLIKYIKDRTDGFPFIPLSLPKLISKRPIFVG